MKLYIININSIPDPKDTCLPKHYPLAKKDRMLGISDSTKRKQAFASVILQDKILSQHGKTFSDIYYGPHNKPLCNGLHFNISHSKDLVICAVSNHCIGCDIENTYRQLDDERIIKLSSRFFHKEETALLEKLKSNQKSSFMFTFYRLWTIKESYLKMTGEGLTYPLADCLVSFDNNRACMLIDNMVASCSIMETDYNEYHISICHQGPYEEILCTLVEHPFP